MNKATRIAPCGKRVPAYELARPRLRQSDFDAGRISRASLYRKGGLQ